MYDADRTKYFNAQNIRVLRFSNREISKNIEKIITKIKEVLVVLPSLKIKGRAGDGL
jgi:very-short-patch-repair endonuclease